MIAYYLIGMLAIALVMFQIVHWVEFNFLEKQLDCQVDIIDHMHKLLENLALRQVELEQSLKEKK